MLKELMAGLLALTPVTTLADEGTAQKFWVEGTTLVFDTESNVEGDEAEITDDDVDRLKEMLRQHPDVMALKLNSGGGGVFAGNEMARVVIDYGLDTVVSGECSSACATIFLGGAARRMERGSKIGFHQRQWSEGSMRKYFERWRKEEKWDTPFTFASWVYEDTQGEIYDELMYIVGRGVDAEFAIQTKRVGADDQWFPSRDEMTKAGVLRE